MRSIREVSTDQVVAEFDGSMRGFLLKLEELARGSTISLPPEGDLWWGGIECLEQLERVLDRLDEVSPEGYRFGPHISAPECYGYWPTI